MTTPYVPSNYRLHLKRLRSHCPPDLPVKVRRVKGLRANTSDIAFCDRRDTHYLIQLDADVTDDDFLCFLLMHEWAHTLAKPWTSKVHHSLRAWGPEYARCYRVAVEGWIPPKHPDPKAPA